MITESQIAKETNKSNQLFPVFIKLDQFHVLIVGGGKIGLEKITAIYNNSPATQVTLIARKVLPAIKAFQREHENLKILEKEFEVHD